MYRVRSNRKLWRRKWPWRSLFPLKVDDRYCRECGLAYHEGPVPEAVAKLRIGDVEVQRFPAGSFRSGEHVVRMGRWKAGGRRFFLSEFIPEQELDIAIDVLCKMDNAQAIRALKEQGWSNRKIARELGMHRTTVAE